MLKNIVLFISGSFIGTILFALYVQFSKKIGNIWIRTNNEGKRTLHITSLLNFMISPFKMPVLWKPKYWDINWPIISTFTGGCFILGSYLYDYAIEYINKEK